MVENDQATIEKMRAEAICAYTDEDLKVMPEGSEKLVCRFSKIGIEGMPTEAILFQ